MDLLIPQAQAFSTVEIKSAQTFQPEFIAGVEHFKNAGKTEKQVRASVWYDGQTQTRYKEADGFKW